MTVKCEDAVSKKYLIERFEERKKVFFENPIEYKGLDEKDKARVNELDFCIASVKQAPTFKSNRGWIPVSEKQPDKDGIYFVSGKGQVWRSAYRIFLNKIGGWINDVSNPVIEAWMPLPEPYTKDDENERCSKQTGSY